VLAGGALALGVALGHGLAAGALVAAALLAVPAAVSSRIGYCRIKGMRPALERTRAELEKEAQWTRRLTTTSMR
jgi:hypothetical protein